MLTELFLIIVSYLGVFIGYGLSKIAKEEVKYGIKNIKIVEFILRVALIISFVYFAPISSISKIVTLIIFILTTICIAPRNFSTSFSKRDIYHDNYVPMAILLGVYPSFTLASLVFLYGFPVGSLMNKESYKSLLRKTCLFLVVGIIAVLIRSSF